MDLDRMLERCRRDQWALRDIDFSEAPRERSEDEEQAICQLFCDMSIIERLAAALFREQARRVDDPRLIAIFETFVTDEVRHSHAAQTLSDHFDRRRLRVYRPSKSLERFFPHFVKSVTYLDDDVANAYITSGELILDIALLRSIADYTDDPTTDKVMRLINRDEARHIAVDYFMVERYASPEYQRVAESRKRKPKERVEAIWTFANVLYWGQPFIRDVFFEPMSRVDPGGTRIREAFKRMQLLGAKPGTTTRSFGRFMRIMQEAYLHPLAGPAVRGIIGRVTGVGDYLGKLVTDAELEEASKKTFAQLADDALAMNAER
jgi:predicted metal-dependent hydrolase